MNKRNYKKDKNYNQMMEQMNKISNKLMNE